VDVAAIEADGEGQVGPRQLTPLPRAAVDEHRLLRTQLVLQPLRCRLQVAPDRARVESAPQRQDLVEQVDTEAVGDQAGELGLEVEQLRGCPLRYRRRQRAEGPRRLRLARAVAPARAAQA
jgi:hypothetical protein